VIAKLAASTYDGKRSANWLKFKCVRDQEFVIGGYTAPKGSRVGLGALLLGYHEGRDLVYAGKVGTGFDEATLRSLHKRLSARRQDAPPFTRGLCARGRRPMGAPGTGGTDRIQRMDTRRQAAPPALPRAAHRQGRGRRRAGEPLMSRIEVEVTHPDRMLFPGITKRDLVDYYREVADTMLPHLKGRPLNVQRFPRGIDQQGFLQQDFAGTLPDWMSGIEVSKEGGTVVHPLVERREALAWLANQNCITLHAGSRERAGCAAPIGWSSTSTRANAISRCSERPRARSPGCWTISNCRVTCRPPGRAGCTSWCRCGRHRLRRRPPVRPRRGRGGGGRRCRASHRGSP